MNLEGSLHRHNLGHYFHLMRVAQSLLNGHEKKINEVPQKKLLVNVKIPKFRRIISKFRQVALK